MNPYDITKGICYIIRGKTIETTIAEICSAQAKSHSFRQDFGCSAQWNTYLHKMVLILKKSNFTVPKEKNAKKL